LIVTNDTASFTGSIPDYYDRCLGPVIFADYGADIARRVAACNPGCVLETAAGTGIVTRELRNLLPPAARLVATDLNPPMLEAARKKFRPAEQVEFQTADATSLPFPDKCFDAAVCQFGMMFYPEKDKSYFEACRVLVPGGRYLFSVWDSFRYNPFAQITQSVIGSFFPADPPQFFQVPFSYYQIDQIKDSLICAGFTEITIAIVQIEKQIENAGHFADGLVHGNPVIDQIRAQGGVDPDRIADALKHALHKEFGAGPCRIPLQAIVFSAAKAS
jgi:SAM-dependent methyltransferase